MSIMAVLSRKQVKLLDKLFYDAPALAQAVEEIRSMEKTAAEQSSDPTAKTAAVNLEPIPAVLGYENPKCNGRGTYMLPVTYFSRELERRTCDLCHGTGRITKEQYYRLRGGGQNV